MTETMSLIRSSSDASEVFEGRWAQPRRTIRFTSPIRFIPPNPLVPDGFEEELRHYMQQQGDDVDAIVSNAGKHFESSIITRATEPPTDEQLSRLASDHLRSLKDGDMS